MFFHHYQPIYNLKEDRITGYEVLLRSTDFSNPETVFFTAQQEKRLYELDSRSIHKAILTYQTAGFSKKEGHLFINIFPSTLLNNKFPSFIYNIMNDGLLTNQQIVFEISEREKISDVNLLKETLHHFKKLGFQFAIDDFGKGYADIEKIIELEPDYLKLDKYFSENLHSSKKKQVFIKNILRYCNHFNIELILEGLENSLDLSISKKLGIPLGQGYKLGRPNLLSV